jgi:DNA-binding SARP family transcriptional activator
VVDHRPEALRVRMLGGFSVGVGSRNIGQNEWRLRRAAALIKLLALAPNHRLHREQIMDKLWPHLSRRAASNNLRRTLHVTRRVLRPAESSLYRGALLNNLGLTHLYQGNLEQATLLFEEVALLDREVGHYGNPQDHS